MFLEQMIQVNKILLTKLNKSLFGSEQTKLATEFPKIISIINAIDSHLSLMNTFRQFTFPCSISKPDWPTIFLVDTGAKVSITKFQSIIKNAFIDVQNTIELSGISSESSTLRTVDTCEATVVLNEKEFVNEHNEIADKSYGKVSTME